MTPGTYFARRGQRYRYDGLVERLWLTSPA
jgi:hypothetical protein